jgi:hypothetical protein
MSAVRLVAIIATSIVVAVVAIWLLTLALHLVWMLAVIAFLAAVLYISFLIARSSLRRKHPARQQ